MTDTIDGFHGTYRFLSNFYPVEVSFAGNVYPSVEHAYQAAKTLDEDARKLISKLKTAGQAKRYGRRVKMRPDWDHVKLNIMKELLKQKFDRDLNPDLWMLLSKTGKRKLVEGNTWHDTYWGVCNGIGANHLGRLLMEIRDE